MIAGIYKISNVIDGRIYIGSAINFIHRKRGHIRQLENKTHANQKLQRFVNKYGIDKLRFKIIELCEPSELIKREQFYIDKYNSKTTGFNILPIAGSWLNHKHTKLSKEKISRIKKGKPSIGMLGKKHKSSTKKLIALRATGRKQSKKTIAKRVAKNTGKKRPLSAIEITRKKTSKLSNIQIRKIRILLSKGIFQYKIANMFCVSQRNICRIKNGLSYQYVS